MKNIGRSRTDSMKNRLTRYNIAIIILPSFFTAIIVLLMLMSALFSVYDRSDRNNKIANARDLVTLYYCQAHARTIESNVLKNPGAQNTTRIADWSINHIEKLGLKMVVIDNDKVIHITDGCQRITFTEIANKLFALDSRTQTENLLYINDKTMVFGDVMVLDNDRIVKIMIVGDENSKDAYPWLLKLLTSISTDMFIVLLFLMIFFSSSLFIYVVKKTSESLIGPIDELTDAAKRIREGDLDEPVKYTGIKEISEFYTNFDAMREQLKEGRDEAANTAKVRALTFQGLSHDAKTAITAIMGYSQGIIDKIANTPEKIDRYARAINDSASALEQLATSMLELGMLEDNSVKMELDNIDICDYIYDWSLDAQRRITATGTDVKLKFSMDITRHIYCQLDKFQFERVLSNIMNNSVKYRKHDGSQSMVTVTLSQPDERNVAVVIADNGTGINSYEADKIFDRFYRSDIARTNVRNGSGIGLSVAKQVVLLHDGNIRAEGDAGKGLKITITLPIAKIGESISENEYGGFVSGQEINIDN